jgi:hypothetical protein
LSYLATFSDSLGSACGYYGDQYVADEFPLPFQRPALLDDVVLDRNAGLDRMCDSMANALNSLNGMQPNMDHAPDHVFAGVPISLEDASYSGPVSAVRLQSGGIN